MTGFVKNRFNIPSLYVVISPVWWQRHFMIASLLARRESSGVRLHYCDVVNQMLQIRHIGYWSADVLSSQIDQITASI